MFFPDGQGHTDSIEANTGKDYGTVTNIGAGTKESS
jgi:hypothetical protein